MYDLAHVIDLFECGPCVVVDVFTTPGNVLHVGDIQSCLAYSREHNYKPTFTVDEDSMSILSGDVHYMEICKVKDLTLTAEDFAQSTLLVGYTNV